MEGRTVFSILPGVGMLANSGSAFNGTAVHKTPYAGAVTDYSVTYFTTQRIIRGSELLIDYGDSYNDLHSLSMGRESSINHQQRPVAELRETGIC